MNLINKHHSKILGIFTLTAIFLTAIAFWPAAPQILKWLLSAILVLSGVMVFWLNKEKLEKSLEASKTDKKNKWLYPVILTLLVMLAFGLRVVNLTDLEPYTDEYAHLTMALSVNDHGVPDVYIEGQMDPPYTRAYFITSLLAFLFAIFGKSVFLARLPGIIISSLTAIPFYFLGKRFNKPIGLLMAGLWAISPWSIGIAKMAREYAYFPFIYILFGWFLIVFAKHFIQIIEKKHWKITPKRLLALFVFCLPMIYYPLDHKSTFMQIGILYMAFFILVIYNLFRSKEIAGKIKKKTGLFLIISASLLLVAVYGSIGAEQIKKLFGHMQWLPDFNWYYFDLILGRADTTFFYQANHYGFYILFALAILFSIYWLIKNKSLALNFLFLTFLGYFSFFTFFFDRPPHIRYGFIIHLWLIPLVALGIYLLFKLYLTQKKPAQKILAGVFLSIFLLTVFSPKNIEMAINQSSYIKQNGYVAITGEFHERFAAVIDEYGGMIHKDDMIVCSLCMPFYWYGKVDLMENNVYPFYPYIHPKGEKRMWALLKIIRKAPSGWMFLDVRRNEDGIPKENFQLVSEKNETFNIQMIERLTDYYIYRWEKE